jgi:hypothetical protein
MFLARCQGSSRRGEGAVVGLLALLALAVGAVPAAAAAPLKVREVFPGTAAAPLAEYVMLQMTAAGQNDVDGQTVAFYDGSGSSTPTSTFTLPSDVPNGASQRTILLATAEAGAALGGDAASPDFVLSSLDRISPAGGAVCFTGAAGAEDCVTWGSIPLLASPFPDPQTANAAPGGIANGMALRRSIAVACPTYLEPSDDSDDSADDFAQASPGPRDNATAPTETRCPPDTALATFPPNPSNDSSPTFTFAETPEEPGASFECELDGNGSFAAAAPCDSGAVTYLGPLADGQHTFRVRATGEGGADASPAVRTWTVDTTAPQTTIDTTPPSPNSGFAVEFGYSSSEPLSSFRCQLDGQPPAGQLCGTTAGSATKSYFDLSNGTHVFRVWAVDNAGNADPTPAESSFQVENSIGDRTPPDTTIPAAPPNPSRSSAASFAYASSEHGSIFQCSLNGAAFAPCPAGGISYSDLANGAYTFAVRAVDQAGNTDSVPASYSWTVAATAPTTRFTRAPAGAVRATGRTAPISFSFVASEPGSTFRCRLDLEGAYRPCESPNAFRAGAGRHVFEVFAVDGLGNEGPSAFRIFRVRAKGERSTFFAQKGRVLSSLSAEISPMALPREGLRPVSLRFASTFENLDGKDIPALRTMKLRLARGGTIQNEGLPRCAPRRLEARTAAQALAACGNALVGRGSVSTAIRFPEGARLRTEARLLLFNAGSRLLMHIHATDPVQGVFVVPLRIAKTEGRFGIVLSATFPRIAADFGQVTGFEMELERTYRHGGERRGYLLGGCPIPKAAGLNRLAFELAKVEYRFDGGMTIRNSTLNTCRALG